MGLVEIWIAHAAWAEGRARTLRTLRDSIDYPTYVATSDVRQHASVWAPNIWRIAEKDAFEEVSHLAFLNDDVTACPNFYDACNALTDAVPDEVIALHTTAPAAEAFTDPGFLRSYWLTGPGYIIPRSRLPDLLKFAEEWSTFFRATNEDNLIMQWAWSEQRPIWHCVPALVRHDTSVPSTLGYDHHAMREATVTWDRFPGVDLTNAETWRAGLQDAPLVPCPWMSEAQFWRVQRCRGVLPKCLICEENTSRNVGFPNGTIVCRDCLAQAAASVILRG